MPRDELKQVGGRCLRPALARLRRSTAFGVLGLAAIAIAGCGPSICHDGYVYRDDGGDGIYTKQGEQCVVPAQGDGSPKGGNAAGGAVEDDSPVPEGDAPKGAHHDH